MHRGDPSSTEPSYSYSIKSSGADKTACGPRSAINSRISCGCIKMICRSLANYSLWVQAESTRGLHDVLKTVAQASACGGRFCKHQNPQAEACATREMQGLAVLISRVVFLATRARVSKPQLFCTHVLFEEPRRKLAEQFEVHYWTGEERPPRAEVLKRVSGKDALI